MLNKLKRTLAVPCLLATACFVILWTRSLKQWDNVLYVDSSLGILEAGSSDGMLGISHGHSVEFNRPEGSADLGFHVMTTARLGVAVPLLRGPRLHSDQWINSISIPFWLLIAASGSVGILLTVRRPLRFSLRTLSIAATLIVLTLGFGVAASRLQLSVN
jgi:hypothetical protein